MFDARAAKTLTPGNHLTIDEAPGLRLEASAARRSWTYRYKSPVDGRMRQVKLGEWPAMPPASAFVAWEKARRERAAGVDVGVQRRTDRQAAVKAAVTEVYTVRRLCDDFLISYKAGVAPDTYADVERVFRVRLSAIENEPAALLTRTQCFDLIQRMRDSPAAARHLKSRLAMAWDHALDAGKLPPDAPNWWRLVLRGKLVSNGKRINHVAIGTGKRTLSDDELGVLIRWLGNFSAEVADLLTLYLWTCCRGAELVQMEREEITREADGVWWTVPREKLKMRRNPRTVDLRVPLIGRALETVERRLRGPSPRWLFPGGKGTHMLQTSIGSAVYHAMPYSESRPEKVRPRLSVTHWGPHDLRRTGRTMLAGMGCPAEIGEAILGHLLPGVQGVYDRHSYNAERRIWLTKLAERLESLTTVPEGCR